MKVAGYQLLLASLHHTSACNSATPQRRYSSRWPEWLASASFSKRELYLINMIHVTHMVPCGAAAFILVHGQRWASAFRGTVHRNDAYDNLSRLWSRPTSFWSRFAGWTIVESSPPNMTGATKVGNEGGSIPSMSCVGSSPHMFVAAAQSYCRVLERCWAVALDHWHRVHDLQQIPIKPKHEQTLLIIAAIFRMMAWPLALNRSPFLSRYFSYPNLWILSCFPNHQALFFFLIPHPLPMFLRGTCWQIFVHSKVRPSSTSHWSHFMMSRTTNARTKQKCVWIYMRGWIVIRTQIAYHCSHFVSYRCGIHVYILAVECVTQSWRWNALGFPHAALLHGSGGNARRQREAGV